RQRARGDKIKIKVRAGLAACRFPRPGAFRSVNGRHTWILSFRQTDPKIELQRLRKHFAPVLRQRFPGDPTHEFIEKKPKRASMITMCGSRRPQGFLRLECSDNSAIINHINSLIQGAKPCLM